MIRFKKVLIYTGITVLVIITGLWFAVYCTGPALPENTDELIDQTIKVDLPELIKGKSGYVISDGFKIWYESIAPKDTNRGAILLFMGISNDALGWPQKFIDGFVNTGYQVIRYDYRGTGLSDWVDNWKENPYSLSDLAKDAVIILDSLKIKKTHLIGVSLGGMVAQEFAINYSDRALTLTSMMSSGNIVDNELPGLSKWVVFDLIKVGIKYGLISNERNMIKLLIAARIILQGNANYDIDTKGLAEQVLYNLRKRKGYNVSNQHHEATYRSGSRYEKLKELKVPALIIHGLNDPFIPIEHSRKLATIIPNAKTKWYDNMGHDLPPNLIDTIVKEIITNLERMPE